MGTQKPVVIGETNEEVIGGPIAKHHGKGKEKVKSKKGKVEEKIKEEKFKKDHKVEELSEMEDTQDNPEGVKEEPKKKEKQGKARIRSKKYKEVYALIDQTKKYDVSEAFALVKKTSLTKFDGNVEVHIRVLGKSGKPEILRGMFKYPHSTGKSINAIILDEKLVLEIEKNQKAEADLYIATPEMMPKIARLAKILGPKGKMPNPKNGTITNDPEKTKKELASGQVEYKTDKYGNIHQVIGKVSAEEKVLEEYYKALLSVIPSEKIVNLTICATMGPGIKVQI
ncbi:MAG: rplA [Candidatus Berkelbacteria bacterium]|nr:rplA [Candidatus Berkelbacteria bacterium]